MNIDEFRKQYPQYDDMSDTDLADSLHKKHYSDMDKSDFYDKFGVNQGSAWERFKKSFVKAGGITRNLGDYMESRVPLGTIGFDDAGDFGWISPDEMYGEGFMEASPEQRREMIFAQRNAELEERFPGVGDGGAASVAGEFAGALADPTTLLPVGQSYKVMASVSAGLGGAFSAAEDLAQTGEVDGEKALKMAVAAGVLAPATVAGARMIAKPLVTRSANSTMNKAQSAVDQAAARGENIAIQDLPRIVQEAGVSPEKVIKAGQHLGKKIRIPAAADRGKEAIRKAVTHDSATSRIYSKTLDNWLGSISTRVKNISEPVFGRLRAFEFNTHVNTQNKGKAVDPFLSGIKTLPRNVQDDISRHLFNGNFDEVRGVIRENNPALEESFDAVIDILEDTAQELADSGHTFEKLPNYFPRLVKDQEGLLASFGKDKRSQIQEAIKAASIRKGKPLDSEEKIRVIDLTMRGYRQTADGFKPRFAKQRKVDEVTPELLQYYAAPDEALHRYLRGAVNDIEKKKFFGRAGVHSATGLDTEASIGKYVLEDMDNLTASQQDELVDLLRSRFVTGENPMSAGLNQFRNLGYMSTIANPVSAVTQLGDLGISAALKGMRNSMASLFSKKDAKLIDLGIDQVVSEEFRDAGKSVRLLDTLLKRSGFKAVDRLGKETFINASLRQARNQVKSQKGLAKLRSKYGNVFGEEFDGLVKDLQNKHMSQNVKLMLFNELSDVQPISLSEMPKSYLDAPNGRILYMLKSFTLKQLDVLRREILQEYKRGNKMNAIKNAVRIGGYMMAGNTGTSIVKDWMQGREIRPEDLPSRSLWALLGVYGLNEYSAEQFNKRGPMTGLAMYMAPASPMIDAAWTLGRELPKDDPEAERVLRAIPLVGPLVYAHFGGGAEKYNEDLD